MQKWKLSLLRKATKLDVNPDHPIIIKVLKGGEDGIAKNLSKEGPGIMVVAGAYERSSASMIFHGSLADTLMNVTDAPLFIAHT